MDKLAFIESKIIGWEALEATTSAWRLRGQRVAFSNGCFDILHRGHVEYLARAAEMADHLVVGLNSDDSVRRLKGPGRPVQDERARAIVLASLHWVSRVVVFGQDTPLELILALRPDVLVKGADYRVEDIVGAKEVLSWGGQVRTVDLTQGYSTTNIINKTR